MRPNRLTHIALAALLAALVLPSVAGAHTTTFRMVNPPFIDFPPPPPLKGPVGEAFVPGRSRGSVMRVNNCRQAITLRGLSVVHPSDRLPGTGDEIICLAHMWTSFDGGGFGTLVMRGEILGSVGDARTSIVAKVDVETSLCERLRSRGDSTYYESRGTRCYEPDPLYGLLVAPLLSV
ncbi:MAG: hypothetical protein ACREKH_09050, partial [Candidatus Rokuibacteriota bacterium]